MAATDQSELRQGMSYEEYATAEGFRAGYLHPMKQSPAHFWATKDDKKTSPAMEFGKLFHYALENGERFMDLVKVEPVFEGYTQKGELTTNPNCKEVKEKRESWRSGLDAKALIVSMEDYETLAGMLKAMAEHRLVKNIIKDGMRETSGFVRCPETGLMLKFRPDLLTTKGHIVDYKSTRDARYWSFYHEIFSDRPGKRFYVLSAAHYAYCAKLMGMGKDLLNKLTYIAVEKPKPHGINLFPMNEACIEFGEEYRAPLMRLYAKCLEDGKWPSYEETTHPMSPPERDQLIGPDTEYLFDDDGDADAL